MFKLFNRFKQSLITHGRILAIIVDNDTSTNHRKIVAIRIRTITTAVVPIVSSFVGKVTFFVSVLTSKKKVLRFSVIFANVTTSPLKQYWQHWQARRDSNPQHPVLETGALTVGATGLQIYTT